MTDPHSSTSELAYSPVSSLQEQLAQGATSSIEIVEALLARIATIDVADSPIALRSIAALSDDVRAVANERDSERVNGALRGPLHGIPILIKDNIEATGLPGAAGSSALWGRPAREAPLVARLRQAGALILGSTNLSQWANMRSTRSTSGYSATGGLVGNPWALDRSAGGSSSGSGAALAAGLAPLAIGTETDGSIVCPASLNGVVGLKPTVGLIPTTFVVPISASQDSPGPMGRSVNDVALLFAALSNTARPTTAPSPTFAVATNWRTGHPETDDRFDEIMQALREDGLILHNRELAEPGEQEGADELLVLTSELYDDLGAYLRERPGSGVASLEDVIAFEDAERAVEQRHFGHEHFLAARATGGRASAQYAKARQRNLDWAIEKCLRPGLHDVDLVLAPAYGPAWKSDLAVGGHPGPASCATMAPAIAGWPIMSLPMGLVHDLPVGLALLGRPGSEWLLLAAAQRIEAVTTARVPLPLPFWAQPQRG